MLIHDIMIRRLQKIFSVAKLDRVKEEISCLKLVFGVFVAIHVSLIAWLAQNYVRADRILIIAGLLGTLVLTNAIIWIIKTTYRRIEELEDL